MQQTELVHLMIYVLKVPSFELVVIGTICQLIAVSLKSLLSPLWGSFWLLPVGMRDLNVHTAYVSSWGCRDVNHLQQCLLLLSFKQFQRLDSNHTWQGMFGYTSITIWAKFKMELEMHNIANWRCQTNPCLSQNEGYVMWHVVIVFCF